MSDHQKEVTSMDHLVEDISMDHQEADISMDHQEADISMDHQEAGISMVLQVVVISTVLLEEEVIKNMAHQESTLRWKVQSPMLLECPQVSQAAQNN